MLDLFSDIKSTILRRRSVYIDNAVFRLHWMITPALLISFAIILTARQYVGQPIDCLVESNIIPSSMLNTYCWISQTFLIPAAFSRQVGLEVPHPGVDNSFSGAYHVPARPSSSLAEQISQQPQGDPTVLANGALDESSPQRKYYPYYQWICFVLFIQAVIFYLPHYIWKGAEGGLMQTLTMDLQVAILSDEERSAKKKLLSDYLFQHFQMYNTYAYKYFFCEFLCLLNILTQTMATDVFLDGQFISYGFQVIRGTRFLRTYFWSYLTGPEGAAGDGSPLPIEASSVIGSGDQSPSPISANPFTFVFPRMTKCTFHFFGASGDVQKKDALCLLPLNVFHEKIYLFLWFWFAFLLLFTLLLILIRTFMVLAVQMRPYILKTRCKFCSLKHLKVICRKGNLGDFFVFYQLGKNVDSVVMQEIVYDVGKRLVKQENYFQYHSPPRKGTSSGDTARSGSKKYHPI